MATSPGCPHEFFTCEELGMVRLYDLRTSSSCHCDGNCNRVRSYFYVQCVCVCHWRWGHLGTLLASLLMYSVPCNLLFFHLQRIHTLLLYLAHSSLSVFLPTAYSAANVALALSSSLSLSSLTLFLFISLSPYFFLFSVSPYFLFFLSLTP